VPWILLLLAPPNLSADGEKGLRRAFSSTRSQDVVITIEAIAFDGARAEASPA
jgi:hypothetical protein